MPIRFKCTHCHKQLSVKEHLAGKKAACPVCKKAILIPPPLAPVDVEALAAAALADVPTEKPVDAGGPRTVDFTCPFCDEELSLGADLAGKKTPCPKCTKLIKVPMLEAVKKKDWRSTQRGGPTAALANLPEQLADAWGTEQKGRVSREAMEEAGALPDEDVTPVGVVGWLKRGFWGVAAVGIVVAIVSFTNRSREDTRERNALDEAMLYLPKLGTLQRAEVLRAAGELYVRKRVVEKARENFGNARAVLRYSLGEGAKEPGSEPAKAKDVAPAHDQDHLLAQLVLSEAEMGGTDEEAMGGQVLQRYAWTDGRVQNDMLQTLDAISSPEAKVAAFRDLASWLLERNRLEVAMSLASNLANAKVGQAGQRSLFLPTYVGLLLSSDKEADAAAQIPKPDMTFIAETPTRMAYTEGLARKKDFAAALKVATAKGPAPGRLEACVAGAAIALAQIKNPAAPTDARPFIDGAIEAYKGFPKDTKAPPWITLELIRLASRTDVDVRTVKELVEQLPSELQARAQLDVLQGQFAKNPEKGGEVARLEAIGGGKGLVRSLAWEALARHNARLGDNSLLSTPLGEEDDLVRPFVFLGVALGEQDRRH